MNLVHTKQDRFSQKLVIDRTLFLLNRTIYFAWSAKADPFGITDMSLCISAANEMSFAYTLGVWRVKLETIRMP